MAPVSVSARRATSFATRAYPGSDPVAKLRRKPTGVTLEHNLKIERKRPDHARPHVLFGDFADHDGYPSSFVAEEDDDKGEIAFARKGFGNLAPIHCMEAGMSQRHRFRPGHADLLEDRVVLSRVAPIAVAKLNVSARTGNIASAAVDQVNLAFDSFTKDYLQAEGLYLSLKSNDGGDPERYFRLSVVQRLNVLSQQLTHTFTYLPNSLNRVSSAGPSGSAVLQVFLRKQITGNGSESLLRALVGVQNQANPPIPAVGTMTGDSATLYTTQSLSAIDASRAATLNAVNFLLHNTFKNGHR